MEVVQGRDKYIILVMVNDIQVEDLPDSMRKYVKTKTYIDAVNIKNQKDLDIFRKKLEYSMPHTPLKDVPKDAADPDDRNPDFPALFNRINRYRGYNRRIRRRQRNLELDVEEGMVEERMIEEAENPEEQPELVLEDLRMEEAENMAVQPGQVLEEARVEQVEIIVEKETIL